MIGDHLGYHGLLWPTHQGRSYIVSDRCHEDDQDPCGDTRRTEWQNNPQETPPRPCAKALGGLQKPSVDRPKGTIEREDHEGHKHMNHADQHARKIVEKTDRFVDQPGRGEQNVDHTLTL